MRHFESRATGLHGRWLNLCHYAYITYITIYIADNLAIFGNVTFLLFEAVEDTVSI